MIYNKETLDIKQYRMPAEFERQEGCIMIWPTRPGSWIYDGRDAKKTFVEIADAVSKSEKVFMLTDREHLAEAEDALSNCSRADRIHVLEIESDDAWARDVGPTFVVKNNERLGISWTFNAWGGVVDGLYANWDKDDLVAKRFCEAVEIPCFDAAPFVLEGGSIHSDGEGTLMVTEACLLSKGRNPSMSKEQIEKTLCEHLGGEKVIWLPYGIYQDETNEHVDNVCAFVRPGCVVLAWTDDEIDPQYALSKADLDVLMSETDARGRKLEVIKLPIPKKPVCITKEELDGYIFEAGEDQREVGERLAASYVNFFISNDSVILPQFGDENDDLAVTILKEAFPERKIVPIYARSIIVGGGNIHCITQQIPEVEK